jgi:hypothetical protein
MSMALEPDADDVTIPETSPPASRTHFDRQIEERRLDLEERRLKQARIDTWTRFLGTMLVGVFIAGGATVYSKHLDRRTADAAREATKAEVAIQLTNAREKTLTDLRAQMFGALLEHYFKQADELQRIAILELMALNFRDAIQIRPMLELLDAELQAKGSSQAVDKMRWELNRAARAMAHDQLEQIRQAEGGGVCRMKLSLGNAASAACFPLLSIKLVQVASASQIQVQTNSDEGRLLDNNQFADPFEVSYFDAPMIDYSAVRPASLDVVRYAIVLDGVAPDRSSANISVAILPSASAFDAQRRYAFDELLYQYLKRTSRT